MAAASRLRVAHVAVAAAFIALGATGARITATLINELERRDARYGIAAMCIGFGQAIAAVIERV